MDWNAAIEKNREALKRILAGLVAMAGLAALSFSPRGGGCPSEAKADEGRITLPRHLRLAVLRLLRPAEAATRRLIIVLARGLVVTPPARRGQPATPARLGRPTIPRTGILLRPGVVAASSGGAPRTLSLPLLDPLPPWNRRARPARNGVPRISVPGFGTPFPVAPRRAPSPDDAVSAARLVQRLQVLGRALDDLHGQARRFARWRAASRDDAGVEDGKRRAAGLRRFRRISPLRPGRPPGWRRKPVHDVHEVLTVTHGLAVWALEAPDTS